MARGPGFRAQLRDSILEARIGGITPATLENAGKGSEFASSTGQLASVLRRYEELLAGRNLIDPAGLFHIALERFDAEKQYALGGGGPVAILPGLSRRGLPGRLIERLIAEGATVVEADEPRDTEAPERIVTAPPRKEAAPALAWINALDTPAPADVATGAAGIEIFRASTPSIEVREALRRVVAENLKLDQVEIVATDPDTYGIALDSLARELSINYTSTFGLPLTRSRLGAALERWLSWIADGLPSDLLREAIESGEIRSPDSQVAPGSLARMLRELRIGWGRERYVTAIARLREPELAEGGKYDPEEETEADCARRIDERRRTAAALATLLDGLTRDLLETPERGRESEPVTTCEAIAAAASRFLAELIPESLGEKTTRRRLSERIRQISAISTEPARFSAALAAFRDLISDFRVWPNSTGEMLPRESMGGAIHLTDVAHAGGAGRPRTFVVGLDADRVIGPRVEDPLLPDTVRRKLGDLPTTAERRAEYAYALARSLAGLRGKVTLSYALSSGESDRPAEAAPLLLRVLRITHADPALSYEKLEEILGEPVSAVPAPYQATVGARDVWLAALATDPALLDGTETVRAAHPQVAAGLDAQAAREGSALGVHHGLLANPGDVFDKVFGERAVSPSSLETLSRCPLAWFYRYALRIQAPDDPEYDEERWLDNKERGSLLHAIYERFVREYMDDPAAIASTEAGEKLGAIMRDAIAEWKDHVPPPSDFIAEHESEEIVESARAFLTMIRDEVRAGRLDRFLDVERWFPDEGQTIEYRLPSGEVIHLHGRIDRIDELGGAVRIVDYKTGTPRPYRKDSWRPPFHGGRQLQPALYAAAIAQATGKETVSFEYQFPTTRGKNQHVSYSAEELEHARPIVAGVIEQVKQGRFLPTCDSDDCKLCDYIGLCRGRVDKWERTHVPTAEWAKENAARHPEYDSMLIRRGHKRA